MKKVIITLCCLVSIFTIQGMQQEASQSTSNRKETCGASIPYVQALLKRVPTTPKSLSSCSTVVECIAAYHPHAAYLESLITYLTEHHDEHVDGNQVTDAMLGPLLFGVELTYVHGLLLHHENNKQPCATLCADAQSTIKRILSQPEYKGMDAAAIAYSKIAALRKCYPLLAQEVEHLRNAQPPLGEHVLQAALHERDAILETVCKAELLKALSQETLAHSANHPRASKRSAFCLPCKLSVAGACALLIMRLMQHSTLPHDIVLEQPVIHLPAQSAPAPHEMLMPHIRQALTDILPTCDASDKYTSEYQHD